MVHGTIHGTVEAGEKIDIRQDAKLVGDIKAGRIIIEDGAYLKGSVDMPNFITPSEFEKDSIKKARRKARRAGVAFFTPRLALGKLFPVF